MTRSARAAATSRSVTTSHGLSRSDSEISAWSCPRGAPTAAATACAADIPGRTRTGTSEYFGPLATSSTAAAIANTPGSPADTTATRRPERFRRLVLSGIGQNVFTSHDASSVADAIESGIEPEDNPTAKFFVQSSLIPGNDPKALAACMRRMHRTLTEEDIAEVTLPVLVVIGDKDFAGPADRLVAALPDAQLVTLRNVEHFATPRAFGFFDAALDFLSVEQ